MRARLSWKTQASETQGLKRPLLYSDRVFSSDLAMDEWHSVLYCLSALDGKMIWSRTLPEPGVTTIGCVVDGVILFFRSHEEHGHVRAYSVQTGERVWENVQMHVGVRRMLVFQDKAVTDWWSKEGQSIALIEPRTGHVTWRRHVSVNTWPETEAGTVAVMIEETGLGPGSVVVGARPENGHEVWRTDLERFGYIVSISADHNHAYCAASNGWLVALDVETGAVAWSQRLDGGIPQRPVVARGMAYTTTQGFFHGFDSITGEVLVRTQWNLLVLGDGCADERYYYASSNDCMVAFDLQTGHEVWRHDAESDESFVPPVVRDSHLYAATLSGRIYCFAIE